MKRPSTDFIVIIGLIIAAVVALQLFSLTSSQSDIIQTQQQAAIKDITSAIKGYQFTPVEPEQQSAD